MPDRVKIRPAYYTWPSQEEWRPCEWVHSWGFLQQCKHHSRPASTTRSCQVHSVPESWSSCSTILRRETKVKKRQRRNQSRASSSAEAEFSATKMRNRGSLGSEIGGVCYLKLPWPKVRARSISEDEEEKEEEGKKWRSEMKRQTKAREEGSLSLPNALSCWKKL